MYEKLGWKTLMAIAAFVVLDMSLLALNFWITNQLNADARAINLAGRQRMLSQQVAKAAMIATDASRSPVKRDEAADEATQAYGLFQTTLTAFANGGGTFDSEGHLVVLRQVDGRAALLLGDVRGMTHPWPAVPQSAAELERFSRFILEKNDVILRVMNEFTRELELQSRQAVDRLRVAHTVAFGLALGNFFFILFLLHRARQRAAHDALTDGLTGLANRVGAYQALGAGMTEAGQTGDALGVMLLDLDAFKEVNDTYGHAEGDKVLKEVARRLGDWQRSGWTCGRLGGDEFVVICPGLAPGPLKQAAGELARLLAYLPAQSLSVSASVGMASLAPGDSADALIAKADVAMYADKSSRRTHAAYRSTPR